MNQEPEDRVAELMEMEPAVVVAGFRSGEISRRDLGKLFAVLGLSGALGSMTGQQTVRGQSNELTMVI